MKTNLKSVSHAQASFKTPEGNQRCEYNHRHHRITTYALFPKQQQQPAKTRQLNSQIYSFIFNELCFQLSFFLCVRKRKTLCAFQMGCYSSSIDFDSFKLVFFLSFFSFYLMKKKHMLSKSIICPSSWGLNHRCCCSDGDDSTNLVIKFNCIDLIWFTLHRLKQVDYCTRSTLDAVFMKCMYNGQVYPFWYFKTVAAFWCINCHRIHTTCGPFLLIIRNVPDLSVTFQHKSNV